MNEKTIRLVVAAYGDPRTESLLGREFRVVPATLVRSQILRNNLGATFLPPEVITDTWADTANGAPVLIDHPTSGGRSVSGRTPGILNAMGVGFLFNVRAENGELKGDVWLDPSRVDAVNDLGPILAKVDNGTPVELSTGFPAMIENVSGTHDGERYDMVLKPAGFDHLAVFAEKTGACSVSDGCGMSTNESDPPATEGPGLFGRVLAALGFQPTPADDPAPASPPTSPQEGDSMNRDQMIAALVAAGMATEVANGLTDCQLKTLTAANGDGTPADPEPGSEEARWQDRALNYRRELEELQNRFASAIENEKEERIGMMDDLLHTTRYVAWNEAQLKAMDTETLRTVHRQVFQRDDFSGRGGPRTKPTAATFEGGFVKPIYAREA